MALVRLNAQRGPAMRQAVGRRVPGRAAAAVVAGRSRAPAVRVVAYRDVHREEKICALGSEVVNAWFKGIAMGPEAARAALEEDVDGSVEYRSAQVLRTHKGQGIPYLLKRTAHTHDKIELASHRILATAACSQDDTYFALAEYKYKYRDQLMGDDRINTGFKIVAFDCMYDDTSLRVMRMHERSSLAPEDVSSLASLDSAHTAGNATAFPEEHLAPFPAGLDNELVLKNSAAWCQARSSGQPEGLLDRALDPSFRLWDAYGVLPVLCDPNRRGQADACVVPYDQVKNIIAQAKERYIIKAKVIDNAVSLSNNAGFTHWCSRIVDRNTEETFSIEAMEVELFGPDGRLTDIWMFRDPTNMERAMLSQGKMA